MVIINIIIPYAARKDLPYPSSYSLCTAKVFITSFHNETSIYMGMKSYGLNENVLSTNMKNMSSTLVYEIKLNRFNKFPVPPSIRAIILVIIEWMILFNSTSMIAHTIIPIVTIISFKYIPKIKPRNAVKNIEVSTPS